jgi:3-oxoacyl-[acyl-carrier protein] reductase
MFSKTETIFGGVDIVVVNAGVSKEPRTVMDSDPSAWKEIIKINLTGAYLTAKAAIPHLIKRGGGKIIFLGSGLGHKGMPGSSAYSSSKAGISLLVQVLAEELREYNITVNELIPGPVKTTMESSVLTNINASKAKKVEWNKEPKDVVPMALFMATQPILGATGQIFSMMRRIN